VSNTALKESAMNTMNWQVEQRRFMQVAYDRTTKAARRAFHHWRSHKRDDAIQECISKVWDSWRRLLLRGKNPEPLLAGLIKWGVWWVRYDRRIAGRARMPDIYDYRANMRQQYLSDQGEASPSDRSDAGNAWIKWELHGGDDPVELAAALEKTGVSLSQWCDLGG
jgi:hypothetical protein